MPTATLPARRRVELQERTASTATLINRDAGIVANVKVLGSNSRNGRTYSPKALETAARLYEGVAVNIDHPDRANPGRERGIAERIGILRNATVRSGAVYADLHFIRSHPMAGTIIEAAERFPNSLGLSHNAIGLTAHRDGGEVVEDIERVRSVDLVGCPATNAGLFESVDSGPAGGSFLDLNRPDGDRFTEIERSIIDVVRSDEDTATKLRLIRRLLTAGETVQAAVDAAVPESFLDARHAIGFLRGDTHSDGRELVESSGRRSRSADPVPHLADGSSIANFLRG